MPAPSVLKLQNEAIESAQRFMELAAGAPGAFEAKDWSLAAKNAAAVATSCETVIKLRNGGGK